MIFKVATTLVAAAILTVSVTLPASAATQVSASQLRVNAILSANPGGVQIDSTTIEWDNGTIVLELSPQSVGTCATGSFCAYSGTNLTGSKLSYSACSTYSVTAITVHSIANARSSDSVQGKNSAGTVLTTVAAGGQVNAAPTGVVTLHCVS